VYVALPTNTQNTFKLSTGRSLIILHSQTDRLYPSDKKSAYKWNLAFSRLLPTRSMFTKSVTVSVAAWKMGVVFREAWCESQWTVLMGYLTISTNVRRYQTHHRWHFFFQEDSAIGAHGLCMQHSPTAAALSTSFLLNHAPNSPELNALITRFRESYSSVSMIRGSNRLKKSRRDWLNSGNALVQHLSEKMRFSCFPLLPGSLEAQVIWSGRVKRLLIAYFIGNVSANKYKNAFTCVKVIANQRWDIFETQYIIVFFGTHPLLNSFLNCPVSMMCWVGSGENFRGLAHQCNCVKVTNALFFIELHTGCRKTI